jgi:hypothetical protein
MKKILKNQLSENDFK